MTVPDQVIIRDADNPAQRPYQNSFSLGFEPGHASTVSNTFTVDIPAGTRLVIERINVLGEMPVGQKLIGANISAFVNNSASGNFIGTSFNGTSPSGVVFNGQFDIYSGDGGSGMQADSGANNFSFSAFRDSTTGLAHVFIQVYGHIVTVP